MGPMKGYGGAVDRPRTAIDVTLETSQSAMFELNLGASSNIYCEARVGRSGHKWCIGTMSLLLGRRSIDVWSRLAVQRTLILFALETSQSATFELNFVL